jgi:hypothetical protein
LWLAESSQQPINQTTWLKVTPHCNHCDHYFAAVSLQPCDLLAPMRVQPPVPPVPACIRATKPCNATHSQSPHHYVRLFSNTPINRNGVPSPFNRNGMAFTIKQEWRGLYH